MLESPPLRREGRSLSLRASQPTGPFPGRFSRLGSITILVDPTKCHAIVEGRGGILRQCHNTPTSTGDDPNLCSTSHRLLSGKVTEGCQAQPLAPLQEEDRGRVGIPPLGVGALLNTPSHKTQAAQDTSARVEDPDTAMGDVSPLQNRRLSRDIPGVGSNDALDALRLDLRREIHGVGSEIRREIGDLTDWVRRLNLTHLPSGRGNPEAIRRLEEEISAKRSEILQLSNNAAQSRAAYRDLHYQAFQQRAGIERARGVFEQKARETEIIIRDQFREANDKASEANREQEKADQLRDTVSGLIRELEIERRSEGAVEEEL